MKRLFIMTLLIVISFNLPMYAQNNFGFPSTNNSFLGTGGGNSTGVDLYTGTAQVSVPICNLGTKDFSIPVSLNYVSGRGVKVQDYATNVGLGWQLNAGGGISRVVRGFPDELPEGYLGSNQWGQQVAAHMNSGTQLPSQINGGNSYTYATPTADGEPDLFLIKTPFFSFQFVFDENGQPVFSNNPGFKIIANNFYNQSNNNWNNSSFIVIDDEGNQYFFGSSTVEKTQTNLFGNSYTFATTWYLDKITSYQGKDNIYFYYTNASNNDILDHYQVTTTYPSSCSPQNSSSITTTVIQPKLISSIESSCGTIQFNYIFDRKDLVNAGRLSTVQLLSKNGANYATNLLKSFNFNYSYFNDPSTNALLLRLRLDKITMSGSTPVTNVPIDYKVFSYNLADALPYRSIDVADFWGYYTSFGSVNGSSDPMLYPEIREPNLARTKAGILNKITDVSGSSIELDYELNTFLNPNNNNKTVGGLRVRKISKTLPTGETLATNYIYNDDLGNSTGQLLSQSYANLTYYFSPTSGVRTVFSETQSNVYDLNGNYIGYTTVKVIEPNGGYTISEFTNFNEFPDIVNYENYGYTEIPSVHSSTSRSYKRGLPKRITVFKADGNKVSEDVYSPYVLLNDPVIHKSWAYRPYYAAYSCNNGSSSNQNWFGTTYSTEVGNFRLMLAYHRDYDQLDQNRYIETTTNYTYASDNRQVKTITTNNSKGGTQSQTFYYPLDMDVSGNGIPMLTGVEQQSITNLVTKNKLSALIHETDYNGITTQTHNTYTTVNLPNQSNVYLTSTSAYNGASLIKQRNFNYDLANSNLLSTYETGGKATSFIYGYNDTYPIAKGVNVLSTSSFSSQQTMTYGGYITSGNSGTFTTTVQGGNIVLQIGFGSYPGSNNLTNVYYSLNGAASASGQLCYSMTGSGCNGYTYSATLYNMPAGTYTISAYFSTNFSNSNPNLSYYFTTLTPSFTYSKEFFYEGFEQGAANASGIGHTGKGYYSGTYSVNFTPPAGRAYVMQWWSLVSNKWNLNEQPYSGTTSLSGNIDDIRIFPTDAQMTSFTYDPLIGVTGETDVSGRSMRHEYDGLQRENIIRDDEGNILKKSCYNYAGQTAGCSLFANAQQSGSYVRNNCSTGTGTTVTYTVPAGKYFSDVDQSSADQLATNDVTANGQNYANANGNCNSLVNVMCTNYKSAVFAITLTNSYNSSQVYGFSIGPNQSNVQLGQVPFGTYNVMIYTISGAGSYSYIVNSNYQSGTGTKYWYNIPMTCTSCCTIQMF